LREWSHKPLPALLLGLEPVQSCLGAARVISEQKVPRRVEQRIVIKFLVGETSRPLKFTTDSNNSMGKSVFHGPVCLSGVSASEGAESAWRMNRMIIQTVREWVRRQPQAFFFKRASGFFQKVGKKYVDSGGEYVED
jgi:hypothetical protein